MRIRLECKGEVLQDAELSINFDRVLIGRGADCQWIVPSEERAVSSHQVVIERRGNGIYAVDQQTKNGTWYRGKKFNRKKLTPGDIISFGGCVLSVISDAPVDATRPVPQITITSGPRQGVSSPLPRGTFGIGSDPAAGLVILDDLVSRKHAEIVLKEDGAYWIRDLKSQNGTSVNGIPLRPDQERMLKNEDQIGIAHVRMRFHDGTSAMAAKRLVMKLVVLGVTLMVATAGWYLKEAVKPSASDYIEQANLCASNEDFESALRALEKAETARNATIFSAAILNRRRYVLLWQSTRRLWDEVLDSLRSRDIENASKILGELSARPPDAWVWNEAGMASGRAAMNAKTAVDAVFRVRAMRQDGGIGIARESQQARLMDVINMEPPTPEWDVIKEWATTALQEYEGVVEAGASLDSALGRLKEWPVDIKGILGEVDRAAQSDIEQVRIRAETLRPVLVSLDQSLDRLKEGVRALLGLEFSRVESMDLRLPPATSLALDSGLSIAAKNIGNAQNNLLRTAESLRSYSESLKAARLRLDPGKTLAQLWGDDSVLAKVLACDSLSMPYNRRSRPIGEFDRFLGIMEFDPWMKNWLNDQVGPFAAAGDEHVPLLVHTKSLIRAASNLVIFFNELDQRGDGYLSRGAALQLRREAQQILSDRDLIVEKMIRAEKSGRDLRENIIAGGLAVLLADSPEALRKSNPDLIEKLKSDYTVHTRRIEELYEKYNPARPEEAIEVREQVLREGLPGNRRVNQLWQEKSAMSQYR